MRSDSDQQDRQDEAMSPEIVPHLRFLKALVAGLALAMVLGLAAIVVILWVRLGTAQLPQLPDNVTLPDDATAKAITFAENRLIVLTENDLVLVYDGEGELLQSIELNQP